MTVSAPPSGPFVVFGPSKSGTTWVQKMLDAHPDVSCLFQPKLFLAGNIAKADGRAVTRPLASPFGGVFPSSEAEEVYRDKAEFIEGMAFLKAGYPASTIHHDSPGSNEERKRIHRVLVRGAVQAFLADSSPKPIRGFKGHVDIDYLIEVFPDARIILLARDGRDVSVSARHHRLRQGVYNQGDERFAALTAMNEFALPRRVMKSLISRFPGLKEILIRDTDGDRLFSDASIRKAAADWAAVLDYILDCQLRYPDNHLLVRYEDLLSDPHGQLKKMLYHVGADDSESILNEIVEQTSIKRLKKRDDAGFFRKGISGDWRNAFTDDDVRLYKEVASDQLIRLGYENSDDWSM